MFVIRCDRFSIGVRVRFRSMLLAKRRADELAGQYAGREFRVVDRLFGVVLYRSRVAG